MNKKTNVQYNLRGYVIGNMKRILYLIVAAVMAAGCCPSSQEPSDTQKGDIMRDSLLSDKMSQVGSFELNRLASLRLYEDSCSCLLAMMYGGDMQELMATGNAHFIRNDQEQTQLDTVRLSKDYTVFFVKAADNTSTYGAEEWYIVYPNVTQMPEGPWCLYKLPFYILELRDTDGDGYVEIVSYCDRFREESHTYKFFEGVLTQLK